MSGLYLIVCAVAAVAIYCGMQAITKERLDRQDRDP